MIRKFKAWIGWPWPSIPTDREEFEIDDAGLTEEQVQAEAKAYLEEMVWNRLDTGVEEVE